MPTHEQIEAAARAIAEAWGERWECCCTARRGLDCDCGDAMTDERSDGYDERLSREDCRMAAKAALTAAEQVRAPSVGVKALDWQERHVSPNEFYAITIMGSYFAYPNGCWTSPRGYHVEDGDIASAKAAAQSDYESRIRSALTGASAVGEAVAWPEPETTNPDIANPTGVPYLDCLLHRLLDAQQDINLEANERTSQSLCDASALIDEVEMAIRLFAKAAPVQLGDWWQPIETAPKDKEPILLANEHGSWVGHYVDRFTSGYRPKNPWQTLMLNHRHIPYDRSDTGIPTHWMPLPTAPTPEKGGA